MDYKELENIIEEIYRDALKEKKYRFGTKGKSGTSDKVSSGSLLKSINAIPKEGEVGVQMNTYGKYVDEGRRPGNMPPVSDILAWVKKNGIGGNDKESVAFAIAKNIEKFGIPASNWMDEGTRMLLASKEFEELLADVAVTEIIDKLEIK